MNRICTICARGGSKGVKNKNIRMLDGRPLIAHSIEQALATGIFATIAVSSDSDDILVAAREAGATILVKRPEEMASDTAAKLPAIRHCFTEAERIAGTRFDTIVDLDATSPLRIPQDIIEAVEMLESKRVSNVITGMPSRRSPYFNLVEINDNGAVELSKKLPYKVVRRQDGPPCYDMNASIYVWSREALLNNDAIFVADTRLYVMPEERSIDIDNELEFEWVEFLLNKQKEARHRV
ncbi:acylneuraminate cytidylyltransferase family protein [Cohnella hashimotonis]|uniref:Acylneuraminate cytidylyltransferase family protein n=1 Tax=Cohnella hashimotonis TaxID=2826895 RepID=A0ABT6TU36_9BACL|nr:acylneuraminate cytidylyltransferase family protein [Cohnella hashimotonis]